MQAADVRPGWTLPQRFYTDPSFYETELPAVWGRGWLFVGLTAELPDPGDTLTWSPGNESVVLVRGDDGLVRAFHNVCRHRGCRIQPDGTVRVKGLVCPYHQWTYGRDGRLRSAWGTGGGTSTDELALVAVPVREVGGLLFISFDPAPPSLAAAEEAIVPQLARQQIEATTVAHRARYSVRANWKVLVENNRECYHCRGNHPEFCLSNYEFGAAGDLRTSPEYERVASELQARWAALGLSPRQVSFPDGDFFRIARLPLRPGYVTESMSGQRVAPRLGMVPADDVGSVRLIFLPNAWLHVNCDYVVTTRLRPVSVHQTEVDVCYLVRREAEPGRDYDIGELTQVWAATSEQDWKLCEANYAGIRSLGYRPGPLSEITEGAVDQFHRWYLSRLGHNRLAVEMPSTGESAVTGEPADERTGTTLRRGIDLVFALGDDEALGNNGLGVSRAAELLNFDKSLVSRTLRTLEDIGVVERDPSSRQYRLSWRLYALAARSGNQRLLEAARPILRELVDALDESAYLSVRDGRQVLTVLAEESARLVQATEKVGTHSALHCTSSGRVLLMDESPESLRAMFPSERLERSTPFAPATVTDLINRIAQCREHGYAAVRDELEVGLFALAVPVRVAGGIVAAINVSAPSYRLSERAEAVGHRLLAAAKRLEHQLGRREPWTQDQGSRT